MPAKTPRAAGGGSPEGTRFVADVLADNIRAYRLLRRLEQDDIAGRMQTLGHVAWRRVTVSEVERGRRNVTVPEMIGLVIVLGATVERLLDPRGPGGRKGPKLLLSAHPDYVDLTKKNAVDPAHVTGLVCSHKVYAEPDWYDVLLRSVTYVDGISELTDVGPEGAS